MSKTLNEYSVDLLMLAKFWDKFKMESANVIDDYVNLSLTTGINRYAFLMVRRSISASVMLTGLSPSRERLSFLAVFLPFYLIFVP
jgi:hypothetical protein